MILASLNGKDTDKQLAQTVAEGKTVKQPNSRNQARILAMQYLYQNQINPIPFSTWLAQPMQQTSKQNANLAFTQQLVEQTQTRIEELDALYQAFMQKGSYHLGEVEKATLRLAVAEMLMQQTDSRVIINEAVNTVKTYGSADTYKLVNAVLDAYAQSRS